MSATIDTTTKIRPLSVEIGQEQIAIALAVSMRHGGPPASSQGRLTRHPLAFLQELARYGRKLRLRRLQERLNAPPQHKTQIDGLDISLFRNDGRCRNFSPPRAYRDGTPSFTLKGCTGLASHPEQVQPRVSNVVSAGITRDRARLGLRPVQRAERLDADGTFSAPG
jgi:hypothetical protein